jgi:hypothetical protein
MSENNQILEIKQELVTIRVEYWLDHVLFSIQWWFLVAITIGFWIIGWKCLSRERLKEILLVGFAAGLIATLLDDLGTALILWSYKATILPFTPRLNPINLTVLPLCYMLLFQWFKSWKEYGLGLFILALVATFIAEPLFVRINIYDPINWSKMYSLPIYILIGIFLKWLTTRINLAERKRGNSKRLL